MIKVLLIEDQGLFREGVNALISAVADIKVVGMTEHGQEAFKQLEQLQPDIVLMDVYMPKIDGIKTTAYIKENYPTVKVILLSDLADEDIITSGLSAGADGFLLKKLDAKRLVRSIRDVYEDQIVLSGEATRILARKLREYKYDKKEILAGKLENHYIYLTRREMDIAYLLMQDTSNHQMAQKLFLSEGTIKNYISDIYNKIGLRKRNEVIGFLQGL